MRWVASFDRFNAFARNDGDFGSVNGNDFFSAIPTGPSNIFLGTGRAVNFAGSGPGLGS